jgi:hypothetical protein
MSKRCPSVCASLLALAAVTIVVAPALGAEPHWYRRPSKGAAVMLPLGVPTPVPTEGKLTLKISKFTVACDLQEKETVESPQPLNHGEEPSGVDAITSFVLSGCASKDRRPPEEILTVGTNGPPPAWSTRLITRGGKIRDEIALGHIVTTCDTSKLGLVSYDVTGTLTPAFSASLIEISPASGELQATRTIGAGEAKKVGNVTAHGKYRLETELTAQEHKEKKKPEQVFPQAP